MSERPRAVIDTNLAVSALVFPKGRITALRTAWQAGHFCPLVSRGTATELLRVLAYPKFELSESDREDLLADYLPYCTTVPMPSTLPVVPTCRDPFDVPFLELAIVGKADWLVTGDKDLLSLAKRFPVRIVTADALLEALIL
ncbi:MAG TPA: putative toxin-antitoxin system toxin component, PIN family [Woeseiaceae bacterium]|nr:putative toxin-antitoxin system toxin component, PIN family [Woeseiaceae bacterium]